MPAAFNFLIKVPRLGTAVGIVRYPESDQDYDDQVGDLK